MSEAVRNGLFVLLVAERTCPLEQIRRTPRPNRGVLRWRSPRDGERAGVL
jgi:hypothetical protein